MGNSVVLAPRSSQSVSSLIVAVEDVVRIVWGRVMALAALVMLVGLPATAVPASGAGAGQLASASPTISTEIRWNVFDAAAAAVERVLATLSEPVGLIAGHGVRVRAAPVHGEVRRLLARGARVVVVCERRVTGGRYWGLITVADSISNASGLQDVGWVRGDLYTVAGRGTAVRVRSC
jgi:hypothetical protein